MTTIMQQVDQVQECWAQVNKLQEMIVDNSRREDLQTIKIILEDMLQDYDKVA